jgi:hypothetical protein
MPTTSRDIDPVVTIRFATISQTVMRVRIFIAKGTLTKSIIDGKQY